MAVPTVRAMCLRRSGKNGSRSLELLLAQQPVGGEESYCSPGGDLEGKDLLAFIIEKTQVETGYRPRKDAALTPREFTVSEKAKFGIDSDHPTIYVPFVQTFYEHNPEDVFPEDDDVTSASWIPTNRLPLRGGTMLAYKDIRYLWEIFSNSRYRKAFNRRQIRSAEIDTILLQLSDALSQRDAALAQQRALA